MFDKGTNGTVLVKNASELDAAIAAARGGETILLRSGDYGNLSISRKDFAEPVTIRSEDPGAMASFGKVSMIAVTNLVIDQVEIDFIPNEETVSKDRAVYFANVQNIALTNSVIEGGPAVNGVPPETPPGGGDGTGNVLGLPTGWAIRALNAEGLLIEGNDISEFLNGIVMDNAENVTVRDNEIYHLRTTPLRGGNLKDVTVEGNYFHDSTPWQFGGKGDHGNFLHFWTRSHQAQESSNFVIRDNVFSQGTGEGILGIHLDDDRHGVGFTDVTIENNLLHNGHGTGIWLENTHDTVIARNTLLQAGGGVTDAPRIHLKDGSSQIDIHDNIVGGVVVDIKNPNGIRVDNNFHAQKHDPNAPNYYDDLFVNAMGRQAEPSDLQALPGSVIETRGVGAAMTRYDGTPDQLTAMIRPGVDPASDFVRHFSAELTADDSGRLASGEAAFEWDFGDGSTGKGLSVSHRYAEPGDYNVTLRVTKDGSVDEARTVADVNGPYLLKLGLSPDGVEDLSGYRSPIAAAGAKIVETSQGFAYRLNDNNDLSVPKTEQQLYALDTFSLSFAIEREALAGDTGGVARMHGSWYLWLEKNGELTFSMTNSEGADFGMRTDGAAIDDTDRHAVTLTYDADAGSAKFYVDGRAVGEMAVWGKTEPLESWGLTIGNPHGENFNGLISDFEIYDKAWSPAEVAELHDHLLAGTEPPAPQPAPDPAPPPEPEPKPDPEPAPEPEPEPDTPEPNPEPAPEPGPIGGGDGDLIDAGGYSALVGDAEIVSRDGRSFVALDGRGDYIDLGRLDPLDDQDGFRLAFEFQRDDPSDTSRTSLFWNHMKYGVELTGGKLYAVYATGSGMRWELVDDRVFDDTDWHRVEMTLRKAGELSVAVDGEAALHLTGLDLAVDGANGWNTTAGGAGWGKQLDGSIDSLTFESI